MLLDNLIINTPDIWKGICDFQGHFINLHKPT